MATITLSEGMRVRARIITARKPGDYSIAGMQLKFEANIRTVVGVIVGFRGDHPTAPTTIGVRIREDDGRETDVPLKSIVGVERT